jgi:RNA polymerase sigma-70 factor (ECF subfamily)
MEPNTTRATLLLRLRPDQPQAELAWEEFYRAYAPLIAGFARKMGAPSADLQDVVHEVMIGFFAAAPAFVYDPKRGRFRGYLKTCTWRIIQRRFGKRMQVSGVPVDEVDPQDVRIEEQWSDLWETEKLRRAMELVRSEYNGTEARATTFKAFEMFAILERSARETADELEISVDSVHQAKSRISRALRATMDRLSLEEG